MAADMRRFSTQGFMVVLLGSLLNACALRSGAPPEPPASVRNGDLAFRDGQYATAIEEYRQYLDRGDGEYAARVYYKTALAQSRLGQHREALQTLDELGAQYPDAKWVQVEALRGDLQRDLGKPLLAIAAWDSAWEVGSRSDRDKLTQRLSPLVRELPNEQLARAHEQASQRDVRELIERAMSRRRRPALDEPFPDPAPVVVVRGEDDVEGDADPDSTTHAGTTATDAADDLAAEEAAAVAATAGAARLTPREAVDRARVPSERAAALADISEDESEETKTAEPGDEPVAVEPQALPASDGMAQLGQDQRPIEGKVGVLLPLSGEGREAGERALRGIRLAFGNDSDNLVIKDTGSDSATALSMLSQLAADPAVKVVIGPVRGDDAERVAPAAERARLPLLLLSQQDGLAGAYALQVGMTRATMLSTLLDYAMGRTRIRNIGILYPEDIAGKQLLVTLRAEVERRGGTVVGSQGYSPATRSVAIGTLMKWRDEKQVQGIFLPDNVAAAEGFARFMQREMPDVTLLGIRGWEDLAAPNSDGREGISGVLFVDTFYPGSERPGTKEFVERFESTFHRQAGTQEAEAYDAALLARRALTSGALTRADVHQELRNPGPIEGAAGELSVTPSGLERRHFLLRVFDGNLQEVGG